MLGHVVLDMLDLMAWLWPVCLGKNHFFRFLELSPELLLAEASLEYIYIGLSRWLSRVDDHSTVDDKPQKYVYSTAALHSTFTLTHQTNLCKSL